MQRRISVTFQQGNLSNTELIGGIEPIRYTARQGNRLTGITRRVTLPGIDTADPRGFLGLQNKFVSEWDPDMELDVERTPLAQLQNYMLYVVPISIAVNGVVTDPSTLGFSEWVQLYNAGDEPSTEWVRYNLIMEGRHLVRANAGAWISAHGWLTMQFGGIDGMDIQNEVGRVRSARGATDQHFRPQALRSDYIGYVDVIEQEFPPIRAARMGLGFRGDPLTGTSSHAHGNQLRGAAGAPPGDGLGQLRGARRARRTQRPGGAGQRHRQRR